MFALIFGGQVIETVAASFPVNSALTWVDVSAATPVPQAGWSATETTGAWAFAAPAAPSTTQLLATFTGSVQAALDASDTTLHRIAEGVVLGSTSWTAADVVAWVNYRRALRALLASAAPGALPARPAFPAGT